MTLDGEVVILRTADGITTSMMVAKGSELVRRVIQPYCVRFTDPKNLDPSRIAIRDYRFEGMYIFDFIDGNMAHLRIFEEVR